MYEVNYQLTRADLAAYRKLMLKRLTAAAANRSWWQTPLAGVAGILAIGAIVWSLLVWFLPSWTRTPLEALSALIGLWFGILMISAASWHRMAGFHAVMYGADGPTLAAQHATFDEAGLRFTGPRAESALKWPLITDVSEEAGIIVLWIEPCQGFVIPRAAFADEAAVRAFCDFARERIAAAKASPGPLGAR